MRVRRRRRGPIPARAGRRRGPRSDTVGVVNTGDDTVLHGLAISPDLDTITYTLAGAIDPERGWGLRDETWRAMEALARFGRCDPTGSHAAPTWFNLGDQDLATHFYRTARLAEGATLTEVTDEIRRAFGLDQRLLPMTDERVTTMVSLADEGIEVSFQEYFVQRQHGVPVTAVRFDGADARTLHRCSAAPRSPTADAVVIAPSNPIVSIGPIRALAGVDALLAAPPRHRRRRLADRRRRRAEGPGRPHAGRARPRGVRGRRRPALRADRRDAGDRPGRRPPRRRRRGRGHARRRHAEHDEHRPRSPPSWPARTLAAPASSSDASVGSDVSAAGCAGRWRGRSTAPSASWMRARVEREREALHVVGAPR